MKPVKQLAQVALCRVQSQPTAFDHQRAPGRSGGDFDIGARTAARHLVPVGDLYAVANLSTMNQIDSINHRFKEEYQKKLNSLRQ